MKIFSSCLAGIFDFCLSSSVTTQDLPSYSTDLKSGFPLDSLTVESFSKVLFSSGHSDRDRNTSELVKRDGAEPLYR